MVKEYDIFDKEYAAESSTDIVSKITVTKKKEEENQTVTGQPGYYDRLKPYRYSIRAKVIN
jgi:hypothetical protein